MATGDRIYLANQADMDAANDKIAKLCSNAITGEVSGEIVTMADSSDLALTGLKLYGKTTQAAEPTPDAPQELISVGATGKINTYVYGKNLVNQDTVSARGNATIEKIGNSLRVYSTEAGTYQGFVTSSRLLKAGTTYTFSVNVEKIVSGALSFGFRNTDNSFIARRQISTTGRHSISYTPDKDTTVYSCALITYSTSQTGDATFSEIQLEVGSVATEFEEFRSIQTLSYDTPNGLPGIPVDSGGNYTDANGQRWICDEVDFGRGVYVQRVAKKVLDGSSGYYDSSIAMYLVSVSAPALNYVFNRALCSHYPYGAYANIDMPDKHFKVHKISGGQAYVYLKDARYASESQWKEALAATPVTVIHRLAEVVETPLSAKDIAAFAAIHTNKLSTTAYTGGDVHIAVEYIADTKTYIDNKFTELQNAILSAGANV